ncbi:MAG: type IV pilin accessory protein [Acinetobacter sp.]|nr:type IV pilin accessory protein [Acinetobacter sp.]
MSNRIKYFLIHLLLSVLVAVICLSIVFFIWYPAPLAQAVGVTQIFLMLIAIDVIIGPILGLIVYKEGKKTLKMDLSVIIILQLIALGFGVNSIEQGRPVWIAYNVDRFELIRKNEVITDHSDQALIQFQHTSWFKPQYVAVQFAAAKKQREEDMFAEVLAGISLAQKPERYVDFAQAKAPIKQRAQPLALLNDFNDTNVVKMVLAQYPQATAFLPLKANAVDMTVLVNKENGAVIKIVDLRPWK